MVFVALIAWSWFFTLNGQAHVTHYTATTTSVKGVSHTKEHTASHGQSVGDLIDKYAREYGVSAKKMRRTIDCESNYRPNVRSKMTYDSGEQERSYGLAQIHLPSHPQVSKAEAKDPEYAVRFMAQHFAAGNEHLWTCARKLGYGS